jgi:hypothetical protein
MIAIDTRMDFSLFACLGNVQSFIADMGSQSAVGHKATGYKATWIKSSATQGEYIDAARS